MGTTRDIELDLLMDKYLIQEGPKLDKALKWASANMEKSMNILNTSINALKLHKIKQKTDNEQKLIDYMKLARDLKENFVRVCFLIQQTKEDIELDKEEEEGL
jgi:hypothetical protein